MKREVIEWVDKAEGDFISAKREYQARKKPNFDICYLCRRTKSVSSGSSPSINPQSSTALQGTVAGFFILAGDQIAASGSTGILPEYKIPPHSHRISLSSSCPS